MTWHKLKDKNIPNNEYVQLKWKVVSKKKVKGANIEQEMHCLGIYKDDIFYPSRLDNIFINKIQLVNVNAEWKEITE